jgi:hypothetical protein
MARTPKKQITWKVDRKASPPTRHRQYFPDVPIPEELREVYEKHLMPGELFVVNTTLRVAPDVGREPPPYPYVIEYGYGDEHVAAQKGDVAIYAGQVRVEERAGKGLIRVPRHSFIVRGGRYLLTNLHWLKPVTWELPGHTS